MEVSGHQDEAGVLIDAPDIDTAAKGLNEAVLTLASRGVTQVAGDNWHIVNVSDASIFSRDPSAAMYV